MRPIHRCVASLAFASLAFAALLGSLLALPAQSHAHEYTSGALHIAHPWIRPTPAGAELAAGYLVLENAGAAPDALLRVESDAARAVELHAHVMEQGMMSMRPVAQVDVPPGGSAAFKPGAYHVMFVGIRHPFVAGERITATLVFAHAPSIPVEFVVQEPPDGTAGSGGMAGMAHGDASTSGSMAKDRPDPVQHGEMKPGEMGHGSAGHGVHK